MLNLVEMIEDGEFNQPCRFGHLISGHAVYCHCDSEHADEMSRKCRRTWYTGGEKRDEECPGFERNPDYAPKETTND